MGINFPAAPIIGELYPTPAVAGIPQYKWDGTVWLAVTPSALTYVQRGGDTMTGHLALPTAPAAANAVRRDFVEAYAAPFDAMSYSGMQINGSMEVSQENGTGGISISAGSVIKYICDGWQFNKNGTCVLVSGQALYTLTPGLPYLLSMGVSTAQASMLAGDYVQFVQNIEGYRTARLGWGTASARPITLSFWVYAGRTGTYTGSIRNGASDRSYAFSYTVNAVNTPEYKTITIPGCVNGTWAAANTAGIVLVFTVACGTTYTAPSANTWLTGNYIAAPGQVNGVATTSDAFNISGVIVLPGTQAPTVAQSPMIMRPYDQELETCQRYYQKIFNCPGSAVGNGGGTYLFFHSFPLLTTMRSTPTFSLVGNITFINSAGNQLNGNSIYAVDAATVNSAVLSYVTGAGALNTTYKAMMGAAGAIVADARL